MIKPGAMLRVSEFAQGDEEIPESQGAEREAKKHSKLCKRNEERRSTRSFVRGTRSGEASEVVKAERGGVIWAKTREIVGKRNVEALSRIFCLWNVQFRPNSVLTFP
ncbi:hypothetical protein [Paenibacillus sp. Root444D2]|uniref:hypothetical protein n=1 Tax=Paenibacillus sp. Root444D2 TaxID=1736538 RepID=UPI00070917F0|nr:hypothetical protein [Paenibacillus sp. Root444D2]KQX48469.1 hypothetical protein ASD40_09725 [Paenibacillus sp. Root444D2]